VTRRLLETTPAGERGSVSSPGRLHATRPGQGRARARPPRRRGRPRPRSTVDLRLRWLGTQVERRVALAALAGRRGRAGEDDVPDVDPEHAVRWALRFERDVEVLGPAWVCEWIADELARRERVAPTSSVARGGGQP
jgi:hypothetical protein